MTFPDVTTGEIGSAALFALCSFYQSQFWGFDFGRVLIVTVFLIRNAKLPVLLYTVLSVSGLFLTPVDILLITLVLIFCPISVKSDLFEAVSHTVFRFFLPAAFNRISSGTVEVKFFLIAALNAVSFYIWMLSQSQKVQTQALQFQYEEIYYINQEIARLAAKSHNVSQTAQPSINMHLMLGTLKQILPPSEPRTPQSLSRRFSTYLARRNSADEDRFSFPSPDFSAGRFFDPENAFFPGNESSIASQSNSNDLSKDEIDCLISLMARQEYTAWSQLKKQEPAQVETELIETLLQAMTKHRASSRSTFNPLLKEQIPLRTLMEENEELAEVMSHVGEWDFNALTLAHCTQEPLKEISYFLFSTHMLPDKFGIKRACLVHFLREIERKYWKTNFYHNALHAADVLNSVVYLMSSGLFLSGDFLDIEVFALFVAALGHDVNHPGVNNSYLINIADPLALTFNDKSVLEMMHSATVFLILTKADCNILSGLKMKT